jgi:transposase
MFFKTASRIDPQTREMSIYYRLVENYRNVLGDTRQRTILSIGRMEGISPKELWAIADGLNAQYRGEQRLFQENTLVEGYIKSIWERLVSEKKLDIVRDIQSKEAGKDWQKIDMQSINNKDIRELGAEWISLQTLRRLGIDTFLLEHDFTEEETALALSHIVSRAVYPASELKTVSFLQENSSIIELTGLVVSSITKDRLYKISHKLYSVKELLEKYLSRKTNELFDLDDKIILYDLTNTYFEGDKRASKKARRGRSKEKRTDCPLFVLALVVNVEGFIKYSAIYEGNYSDSSSIENILDKLQESTGDCNRRVVVIDAGIATEANLAKIVEKNYDYVCVSRRNLKEYSPVEGQNPVYVQDRKKRKIELTEVQTAHQGDSEYYLKVTSEGKQLKESSMHNQFTERFEEGLQIIAKAITSKHGTKQYDKVNQRIGRLKQRYPSVHRMYRIELEKDEKDVCRSMQWSRIEAQESIIEENQGVYFIRTSLTCKGESLIWVVYNCIREVESSFRCLKSDLSLRPVFHKTDDACDAHLHLGLLAYRVVNTIRFQLKKECIHSHWREIVRVMNTQKCVTTTMNNDKGQTLAVRCCSQPTQKVRLIYAALKMKEAPFVRKKSVVLKIEPHESAAVEKERDTG